MRDDVAAGVGKWLPSSVELEVTLAGAVGDSPFTTVRWIHHGENRRGDGERDNPFLGVARDASLVEVHGITLVEDRGGAEPHFHRYVDWAGVYDQLGLAVSGRLRLSDHPGTIQPPPSD